MARRFEPAANSYGVEVTSPRERMSAPAIGELRAVTGLVTIKRAEIIAQACAGDSVYLDDVIETGADGSVTVVFVDGNAFYLRPGTVMVLDEFVFNPGKSRNSALFRILKGAFTVIAGKLASGGRLIIETPLGQIQNRAPGAGIGSLAFGILTFNLINELKAATLDPSPISDDKIDLNWLQHGAFIVYLNNGQSFVADDDTKTYFVPRGGGSLQVLTNTPQEMESYHRDFVGADTVHQAILNDVLYQQHAFNQPNAGATGGGDNPNTLGLNGNGNGQGPTFILPVIVTGGNTISDSGGSTGKPLVVIPPPSLPSNIVIFISPANTGHPSDFFVVGANWDTGSTPSTSQTAEILALPPPAAIPLIVQLQNSANIGGLIIGAGVILQITNGATLTVANGIQNAGMIEFLDPPILSPNGSMFLDGGGIVVMPGPTPASADNTLNQIIAAKPGSALVNVDNTIIGGNATIGNGDGALTLVNQAGGTIDATSMIPAIPSLTSLTMSSDGVIVFNTGNTIINAGLLEATGSGTLDVKDSEINNSGTGSIGIVIDGTSKLLVDVGSLKLDGTGKVALNGGTITGQAANAGNELENFDNTIVGTGTISNLDLDNDAAGIINATAGTLILQTGATIDNAGLLEATGSGTLQIDDNVTNTGTLLATGGGELDCKVVTITNFVGATNGTVEVDTGSTLDLEAASIVGGIVSVAGLLDSTGTSFITGAAITITSLGTIESTSGKLTIDPGSITNSGTLEANGGTLEIDSTPVTNTGKLLATNNSTFIFNGGTIANFVGSSNGTVQVDIGSTFKLEAAAINGGIVSVAGLLSSSGTSFITDATITDSGMTEVLAAAALTLSNDQITNTGGTTKFDAASTGTLSGTTVTGGTVTNNGTLNLAGTSDKITGTVNGAGGGIINIANGTLADFEGTVSGQNIQFATTGTLEFNTPFDTQQVYSGDTISGFALGTVIDLTYLPFSSGPTFTFVENATHTAGTLTIKDGTLTEVLTFNGNYTAGNFALISDGGVGTDIVFAAIDEWTNTSGGSWNTASNWSSGVPGPTTNAAIDVSGTYTVTVSGTETANSLSIGDLNATLSGSGTLEIKDPVTGELHTISNSGTIIASVANQTLAIMGNITGPGTLEITNKATLELGGTSTNEVVVLQGQSTLQIDSSGTSSPFSIGATSSSIPDGEIILFPHIIFDSDPLADSYHQTTTNGVTTGVLIVTDKNTGLTVTVDVIGGAASGRSVFFSQSGTGGTQAVFAQHAPAGTAGSPINLALANPSAAEGKPVSVTITGVPSNWVLNEGTNLGNGTWTVQTEDLSALTVITAAAYAGAMLLGVTETWTNADGTTGQASFSDNVEAYAPNSPIFALANIDILTGAGGNDLFVFEQPIGNDTIYNFNALSDKIDLVGFDKVASFSDLQITDDANGNAVITVGSGETITLHGVDAASLTASNFVFDQTPTFDNVGTMTISDGAELPIAGIIDNSGIIELNATGDLTDLVILGDGATLEGGGQVILSGDGARIVGSTSNTTLTNVDNAICGVGQIGMGDGNLTLINEAAGTIDANVAGGTLTLDTGHTIVNYGVLEASNGGTLQAQDAVTGGTAVIAGGTIVFDAAASIAITFDNGAGGTSYGVLVLIDPSHFTGDISGFAGTAADLAHSDGIDVLGLNFNSGQFSDSYDSSTGMLTLSDGTNTETLQFAGFNGDINNFHFAEDANGTGTLITDPPGLEKSATVSAVSSQIPDTGTATQASNLETEQSAPQPQQNTPIAGTDGDRFVFAPGIGSETVTNFNWQQDTIELDHFANAQTVQELQSLITTDVHGDAVINLGHNDSATLTGTTTNELQQVIQAGHILLH